MIPILYKSYISYTDIYEEIQTKEYEFYARDDLDAGKIASELFLIDEGISNNMNISIEAVTVNIEDKSKIMDMLNSALNGLSNELCGLTYPEFIRMFVNFGGKGIVLGKDASYYIKLMGFIFKVYLKDYISCISTEEVLYEVGDGRMYSIRGKNIYIVS